MLPARFPNLLVNGSQGIAVGMATNIPPHNLGEVIDATVHLIDNPEATPDDLMQFVKGPDFPTGGSILGRAGIIDAYRTGRGSVKMRATAEIEETQARRHRRSSSPSCRTRSSCSTIAGRIEELVDGGELDGIADVNDESAGGKTRLVIKLKRDANANVVLNNLFKHTQLQTSFAVNMVALVDGVPRTLNLAPGAARLRRPPGRGHHPAHAVPPRQGAATGPTSSRACIKALDVIDEIIALIRGQRGRRRRHGRPDGRAVRVLRDPGRSHPRHAPAASSPGWAGSTSRPSSASCARRIAELEAILADDGQAAHGHQGRAGRRSGRSSPRRGVCQITFDTGDMIDRGPRRRQGARRRDDRGAVRQDRRRPTASRPRAAAAVACAGPSSRPTTSSRHVIFTTAHAYLLFFSNRGQVYRLRAHEIPERERTAKGMPIVNLLPLQPGETIQAIIDTRDFAGERYLFFATRKGTVKKTTFDEYDTSPPRRAHRHQPARRRRARAGHRDQRQRRHLHGQPQGHDHPLQRGRGAADGPRRRRRARHEAAARRRGRVGATSPATTRRS